MAVQLSIVYICEPLHFLKLFLFIIAIISIHKEASVRMSRLCQHILGIIGIESIIGIIGIHYSIMLG